MEAEKIFVASLSGGKDSVAMCLMLLQKNVRVDYFVFADTGMEFPECYDAIKRFEELTGRKVLVLRCADDFLKIASRRKKAKDNPAVRKFGYGWPNFKRRWCTSELKTQPIKKFIKTLKGEVVQFVGIAADEAKRLRKKKGFRYPLAEWGMTENDCLAYCLKRGFYAKRPCAYDCISRMSCFCCPLANKAHARYLFEFRPDLWQRIKDMEKEIGEPWKRGTDYYEKEFATEEQQGNLFTLNAGEKNEH